MVRKVIEGGKGRGPIGWRRHSGERSELSGRKCGCKRRVGELRRGKGSRRNVGGNSTGKSEIKRESRGW